jgi:hypothetical protein
MQLISDQKKVFSLLDSCLTSGDPLFLSRIGGSDTELIMKYRQLNFDIGLIPLELQVKVKERNGFYDKKNDFRNFEQYVNILHEAYLNSSNHFFVCNSDWLQVFFPDFAPMKYRVNINSEESYYSLINEMDSHRQGNLFLYPYNFVENIVNNPYTLFNLFASILKYKKVLVISPFSESVLANKHNSVKFFRNYEYPDFELTTVNVPITYSGMPLDAYPHLNWVDTLNYIKECVSAINFDIALLSCGSYSMPIGSYISNSLRKKSIYVGGVLQLYFGIIGGRYLNTFFLDQINSDSFIRPLEKEKYEKLFQFNESADKEGFNAYF